MAALLLVGCGRTTVATSDPAGVGSAESPPTTQPVASMNDKVVKTDQEWRRQLTPEQYRVLRQKDTESAFTGAYVNTKKPGVYHCAGCGAVLFNSEAKFDSGCGWPSFYAPAKADAVATNEDRSLAMDRTEVLCPHCGGHLGHVFDDGPQPTGLRYCINSASLRFEAKSGAKPKP